MSELRVRSRNGCLTCRNRRKKCDEIRPECHRCRRAGIECLGYSHLDNPAPKSRKPRNNISVPTPPETSPSYSKQPPDDSSTRLISTRSPLCSTPSLGQNDSISTHETWSLSNSFTKSPADVDLCNASDGFMDKIFESSQSAPAQIGMQHISLLWRNDRLGSPVTPSRLNNDNPSGDAALLSGVPPFPDLLSVDFRFPETLDDPVNNYQAPLVRDYSQAELALNSALVSQTYSRHQDSIWPSPRPQQIHETSDSDDESDTEGVISVFGPTLTLDPTASNNSLPFILSSYLRWMMRSLFEPLKVAPRKREQLISRYMCSDDSRYATMLVASVMESLDKNPTIVLGHLPAMRVLESRVNAQLAQVKSSQQSLPGAHACDVLAALHNLHEMISLQCLISPLSKLINIIGEAAPIYRKACPEPPGTRIHLPAKLLHPESVLRHFPALDVLISFNTGRPMQFRYDTSHVLELCEHALDIDLIGLQWMNGVPDHFLVMLARMNMLLEDVAPTVDPQIIQGFETGINSFEPILEESPDPYLKIARLMVYEAWRQVMYIYLYMGLCGVASNDMRVETALKKFVRLLDGVKPGRMPDIFLVLPMCAAGVAAHKQRDRDVIRGRILGIRECTRIGTCGNDVVQTLNEIWTVCNMQGRYAVWSDLRVAASRVTGII